MKPSERIEQLQRQIADERTKEALKQKTGGESFLMAVTGTSEADLAEHYLRDHLTLLAAIVAYLDEQASK